MNGNSVTFCQPGLILSGFNLLIENAILPNPTIVNTIHTSPFTKS